MTTTTLGFSMFSFEGDKSVEAIANYFRNRKLVSDINSPSDIVYRTLYLHKEVITALENLRNIDKEKFGEATDTAVREAVLNYVDDGVRTVDFGDGDVRNFPPTVTPGDYDYLKDSE